MTWAYQPLLPSVDADKKALKRLSSVDFTQYNVISDTSAPNLNNKMSASNSDGTIGVIAYGSSSNIQRVTLSGLSPSYSTITVPVSPARAINFVKFVNDKFYLFTDGLGVLYSYDALNWTVIRNPDSSGSSLYTYPMVQCNGDQSVWIAQSSSSGQIFRSTDLINWSTISGVSTHAPYSIIWDGTQFVAATDNASIYTSPTGVTWTLQSTDIGRTIAFSNGLYVSVYFNDVKTSTNLTSWTTVFDFTSAVNSYVYKLDLNSSHFPEPSSLFFISDYTGKSGLSYDGDIWYDLGTSGAANDFGNPGAPMILGQTLLYKGSSTRIIKVYPKLNWESLENPLKRYTGRDFDSIYGNATSVTVSSTGSAYGSVVNDDGTICVSCVLSDDIVQVVRSSSFSVAIDAALPQTITGSSSTICQLNNTFYLASRINRGVYSSTDGVNWTTVKSLDASGVEWQYGMAVNSAGNIWIIFDRFSPNYHYSTDLINWTQYSFPFGFGASPSITWGPSGFLVSTNTTGRYLSSTDGINWTASAVTGYSISGVSYALGYYYSWNNTNVYRSADLTSWSAVGTTSFTVGGIVGKNIYGQDLLFAVGSLGSIAKSTNYGSSFTDISQSTIGTSFTNSNPVILGNRAFLCGGSTTTYRYVSTNEPPHKWDIVSDRLNRWDSTQFEQLLLTYSEERELDGYSTGLWGVYSVYRRLLSSYTGYALRVRRASDNFHAEIPFASNRLDQKMLSEFLEGTTGYIVQIYDQSGNGNHITSTAFTARQPQILLTNPGTEFASFDASDDQFVSPNIGTPSALTFFMKGTLSSTTDQMLIESSDNYTLSNNTLAIYYSIAEGGTNVATHGAGTTYARSYFGDLRLNNNVQAYRIDRNAVGGINQCNLFIDGVFEPRVNHADTGTISGTFDSLPLRIGARGGASITLPSDLELFDFCVYNTALNDVQIKQISTRLNR